MRRLFIYSAFTVLSGLTTVNVCSQTIKLDKFSYLYPATEFEQAIISTRQDIQTMLDRGVPGASIAVSVDGQLVWAEGFGYANVEHRVPVTPLTKFRVGSVAKPMTSIAIASLLEEGKIDLDSPIQTYLPDFPVKPEGQITLRLLASHRAGIRHYRLDSSDVFIQDHYDNVFDSLELFANDPLVNAPGEKYSYSSYGYNLLSAVLQQASGEEFLALMRNRVFAPLRMRNTVADQVGLIIEHRAAPYELSDGKITNSPFVDNSYKWAGGGFLSTPTDLVQFGYGVFNSGILKRETVAALMPPAKNSNGQAFDQDYGLGWRFIGSSGEWVGHGGGSVGGNTLFLYNPKINVGFAFVCNQSNCLGRDINWTSVVARFIPTED